MLYARAGDETQGGPDRRCYSPTRGMFVPQAGVGLGGFLQEKKSGAFSSPLKKLCLFDRRKEFKNACTEAWRPLQGRSLRPVTGGGEGDRRSLGSLAGGGMCSPSCSLPVPSWIRGVALIGVLGGPAAPWLRLGGPTCQRHSCVSVRKGSESLELSRRTSWHTCLSWRWWM